MQHAHAKTTPANNKRPNLDRRSSQPQSEIEPTPKKKRNIAKPLENCRIIGSSSTRALRILEPFGTKRRGHISGALRPFGIWDSGIIENPLSAYSSLSPLEPDPQHSQEASNHPKLAFKIAKKVQGELQEPLQTHRIATPNHTVQQPYLNPHRCRSRTGTLRNFLGLAREALPELSGT